MRRPEVQPLIYSRLFPRPQARDPVDFSAFVSGCIIPEVRAETQRFYGQEQTLESSYPGLDYASKAHRTRLRLYTWHRRLFRVFDELRLSEAEIYRTCKWEGTKQAKDRYEREHNTTIRNTTWDGVRDYNPPLLPVKSVRHARQQLPQSPRGRGGYYGDILTQEQLDGSGYQGGETSETDDEIFTNSFGDTLQQQLLDATARASRGEPVVIDAAWEQWMKDVTERGLFERDSRSYPAIAPTGPTVPSRHYVPILPSNYQFYSHAQTAPEFRPHAPQIHHHHSPMSSAAPPHHTARSQHRMPPPPLVPYPRARIPRHPNPSSASPAS